MPRPLRPIADGTSYHVINRGNNRQTVFQQRGRLRRLSQGHRRPQGAETVRAVRLLPYGKPHPFVNSPAIMLDQPHRE